VERHFGHLGKKTTRIHELDRSGIRVRKPPRIGGEKPDS
jgi:hypothetical protein